LREPFQPIAFMPLSRAALGRPNGQFLVRSAASTSVLSASLAALGTVTGTRHSFLPLDQVGGDSVARERLMVAISVPLAVLALVLTAVGLYGVTSHSVAQRGREIGIRVALGATQPQVRNLIVREATAVSLVGVLTGVLFTTALGKAGAALLFELSPYDPISLCGAALVLTVVAVAAASLAARRVAQMEPVASMRGH
jgi:putative ABC transport system permease protein